MRWPQWVFACLLFGSSLFGREILFHNCPLASIGSEVITLKDVITHLELQVIENAPDYVMSSKERYAFYSQRWSPTVDQMIDEHLMLMAAKEHNITIKSAEVKKRMQDLTGKKQREILDRLDITYEELFLLTEHKMMVEQIIGYHIYQKAMKSITPYQVNAAYDALCQEALQQESITYQVIRWQGGETISLAIEGKSADSLYGEILEQDPTASLSPTYSAKATQLSPLYRDILLNMQPGDREIHQSPSSSFLLFCLERKEELPPSFADAYERLRNVLLSQAFEEQQSHYLQELREWYTSSSERLRLPLPCDYVPFALSL
ncbi:MAG: hypothetical protein VXZ72_03815 [Chlamydiota bacterium]|nr:hypothetical protein [Chlamydiota bacterium]